MGGHSADRTAAPAPQLDRLEFVIPSVIPRMHELLQELMNLLEARGIAEPNSNIVLALDEAIANAIKHGNHEDPTKQVHVVVEFMHDEVTFTITDEGDGFDLNALPDPTDPSCLMRTCGRGVMLIYHIMDEVEYNARGNQVRMKKKAER
ncbi:ATP-binding protein [Chloracidobacterium sp. MS 40/45]|uniref:ATP-binding protein n=1 Tax=Chloracidobacterium aggregatum TaxID=2851959 RepID=UPI001B8B065C|nr:ATP-binding protein [Chloracidobacterium aggregatum]QUW00440.1 ATP-binding protein [Chloracidobacterium sp. MS 40/45]